MAKYVLEDSEEHEEADVEDSVPGTLWKMRHYSDEPSNACRQGGVDADYTKWPHSESGGTAFDDRRTLRYRKMISKTLVKTLKEAGYCHPENVVVEWE